MAPAALVGLVATREDMAGSEGGLARVAGPVVARDRTGPVAPPGETAGPEFSP